MPKKTFFKLSEEKQQRILNAAKEEFIEHKDQYAKSSVNRIAEKAEISVGSIYKYFKDKEDLFFCVFNQNKKNAEALPESDTLYRYFVKETDLELKSDQTSNDMVDIIVQNAKLFQGLVFDDIATQDYLNEIRAHLTQDQERGLLKEGLDLEVAAYLYATMEFNAYQYARRNGQDFSMDTESFHKMTQIFFFGIYRDGVEEEVKG